MKKTITLGLAILAATMASCTGKSATTSSVSVADEMSVFDSCDSLSDEIKSVLGEYSGILPTADCPGIKTTLTLNADGTYHLKQEYLERSDDHDEARGVFNLLDNGILMLVRPSSGELTFFKVKDAQRVIMIDSLGNEPEGEMANLYILTKSK